jgi:predicted PurR-regulated permease PerM
MTRLSDIVKIFAIAALLAMVLYYLVYYLAHYGLACPENVCDVTGK